MEMPQILFSKWFQWNDREQIEHSDLSGVYILAKFKEVPEGSANPNDENIIYAGETCSQTLEQRWYQFNNSAFRDKDGHSVVGRMKVNLEIEAMSYMLLHSL